MLGERLINLNYSVKLSSVQTSVLHSYSFNSTSTAVDMGYYSSSEALDPLRRMYTSSSQAGSWTTSTQPPAGSWRSATQPPVNPWRSDPQPPASQARLRAISPLPATTTSTYQYVPRRTTTSTYHYLPLPLSRTLRPIAIDGQNVAYSHGQGESFSIRGIEIIIRWFEERGHTNIIAFLPEDRKKRNRSTDQRLLLQLDNERRICFTPSREVDGEWITPHDDQYILDYAARNGAIVVTRDHYRDHIDKKPEWAEVIRKRILPQTFVCGDDDVVMFPPDPLGRGGPTLDEFLRF